MIAAFYVAKANRLAVELREVRAAYESMRDHYRTALLRLDAANEREADLRRVIADLEHHVECMGIDNAELERALEAMTKGLRWFEGSDA